MMRRTVTLAILGWAIFSTAPVWAQFKQQAETGGPALGEAETQYWRAGMTITAAGGPCRGMVGYVPVPVDWPEQKVTVVKGCERS